jgi:hypothetical protein
MDSQIKSRERVRDLAEVYTAEREVNAMLDLLGDVNLNITARYLEPSCGNGNFLVAILERKMKVILSLKPKQREFEFLTLQAVASIYGVDIMQDNILQARDRMRVQIVDAYSEHLNTMKAHDGFYPALDLILETNIQVGDMLNGVDRLVMTEFTTPRPNHFARARFRLHEMMRRPGELSAPPKPFERLPATPYWRLAE